MSRAFSNQDILEIKRRLQSVCEENWKLKGYIKTSIPFLTKEAGISTGAFYLIYKRKEDLFLEVLENIQQNLLKYWLNYLNTSERKIEGFKKGLMWLFHEYRQFPNVYDTKNSEYALFSSKLSSEQVAELKKNKLMTFDLLIDESGLELLLPKNEVINIIQSILFLSLANLDSMQSTEKTFVFLVDHTLYHLFKEVH